MSNATEATGQLTPNEAAGTVTLTLSSGETYTTKNSNGFLGRLDRMMAKDGWRRNGYRTVDGALTTSFARAQHLADFVAQRDA